MAEAGRERGVGAREAFCDGSFFVAEAMGKTTHVLGWSYISLQRQIPSVSQKEG
jgi:hypothetical protein